MKVELDDRYWSKVDKTGSCWTWTSVRNRPGRYGHFTIHGKKYLAHRLAWFQSGREIPVGMVLDHICGNPICVRIEHLQLVTQALNTQNLRGAYKTSRTGIRGVSFREGRGYVAQAQIGGKKLWKSGIESPEEAEALVIAWRREHMPNSLMDRVA